MSIPEQNVPFKLRGVIAGVILLIPITYAEGNPGQNQPGESANQSGKMHCPLGTFELGGQCMSDKAY